ncbi:uncharacterized protein N7473_002473 [Penicillium subrubescens]|nr:uncharacterized protein N7473_002473 [Penicillium subrubescens]KAJ5905557.1 hypothetical protein N7473_002473 [Penicillium subrubescens]
MCCQVEADTKGIVFEIVRSAAQAVAFWEYISRLLDLLKDSNNRGHTVIHTVFQALVLQELPNAFHFEFDRVKESLRQHISKGTRLVYFLRVSIDVPGEENVSGMENASITKICKPEDHTRKDPLLHYLMRLCQPDLWGRLKQRKADSLVELANTAEFDLSSAFPLLPYSDTKGRNFLSRVQAPELELDEAKVDMGFSEADVPLEDMVEPMIADDALRAAGYWIRAQANTDIEFLYEDLVQDCLCDLQTNYEKAKARIRKESAYNTLYRSFIFARRLRKLYGWCEATFHVEGS